MNTWEKFTFVAAEDPEMEDNMYVLNCDNNWYIQDASEYGGRFVCMTEDVNSECFTECGDAKTLYSAMCLLLNAYNKESQI